jgi:hypothetical protein
MTKPVVLSALFLAALLLAPLRARAADPNEVAIKAAQTAAKTWLALVDAGKYGESYDQAASFFRKAISKDQWKQAVTAVRGPLGALVSRHLKSSTFTRNVPGAPAGQYVIIQFETKLKNKAGTIETITPMLDADKKWHVSGYFIK